ncbi:hypothetical protein [Candidatus Jettenia sp. AMX1]|nr:hypothetical protein [Candidatus Jettenia sp. AMX1]WKZ14260.1 MAG: hypothetical protein QY317_10125 [Candidatus Jettenia caeni]
MINCFDSVLVWKDVRYRKRSEVHEWVYKEQFNDERIQWLK